MKNNLKEIKQNKVGIIGGSGFIGSYNTKKFLEEGYPVRVSVTDISKEAKYQHLRTLPNSENLEIVELDVQNRSQLAAFLEGCAMVVHGGTPFQLDVEDPQRDLLDPTVKGTENFLRVVSETPSVKKVVFVASVAAHNTDFPMPAPGFAPAHVYTEEDKPYCSQESHPYCQAKYYADQAVRKFTQENPAPGFDIVTVSPVGVMGNQLSGRADSTSMGVQFLFKNKIAPNPFIQTFYDLDVYWALVDVADVAESVYKAAILPNLHGKHYLITSESYRVSDICLMLNGKEPVGQPATVYSNALATQDLGIHFKPAKLPLHQYAKATEGAAV